jgi:ADP-dependent NAD(P)H-hydrate dehydratase / NAD(P)H-hydrate epimerase
MHQEKKQFEKIFSVAVSPHEMASYEKSFVESSKDVTLATLMERAGASIAKELLSTLKFQSAVILCGHGNNGGDGLVVARYLVETGKEVKVIIADAERYSDLFILNASKYLERSKALYQLKTRAAGLYESNSESTLTPSINKSPDSFFSKTTLISVNTAWVIQAICGSDIVVDALLGTGQYSEPRGIIKTFLEILEGIRRKESEELVEVNSLFNKTARKTSYKKIPVISIDVPTGVDADAGAVFDNAVNADYTYCLQYIKRGLLQFPAKTKSENIKALDIGLYKEDSTYAIHEPEKFYVLNTAASKLIKKRKEDVHKGSFGHVLVIGGSHTMPGAPVLAANAALRAGAGLVTKLHHQHMSTYGVLPEIMYLQTEPAPFFTINALEFIKDMLDVYTVYLIGPGIGDRPQTIEFIYELLKLFIANNKKFVLDADALKMLKGFSFSGGSEKDIYGIITPHPGEAAKLLDVSSDEIQKNRYKAVKKLQSTYPNFLPILKGASTVIWNGDFGCINTSGNSSMATAGSGDVLSGIVAALIAQGYTYNEAAALGVFYHGYAGDVASEGGKYRIIASDIIDQFSKVFF